MVHPHDEPPRVAASRAAASSSGTRPTCARGSRTGSRASTATGACRASASSACRSRCGTRSRQDGTVRYDQPLLADEAQLPMDPSTDVPAGYEAAQRGVPGGFIGDPDVMDTWATSSLTPQIVGAVGRGRGLLRPRVPARPAAAGARHHPHLAVLDGAACPPRARRAAVEACGDLRLGARSRSQEDVQVQGQRRHAHGPARGARIGCGALLGGERPSRRRHRVRHRPDARRPPPGDQAAQRREVRARAHRADRRRSPRRSIAGW